MEAYGSMVVSEEIRYTSYSTICIMEHYLCDCAKHTNRGGDIFGIFDGSGVGLLVYTMLVYLTLDALCCLCYERRSMAKDRHPIRSVCDCRGVVRLVEVWIIEACDSLYNTILVRRAACGKTSRNADDNQERMAGNHQRTYRDSYDGGVLLRTGCATGSASGEIGMRIKYELCAVVRVL